MPEQRTPAMPRQIDGIFKLTAPRTDVLDIHADMEELTRRHGEERAVIMAADSFAMMVRANVIEELTHQRTAWPCP